MYPSFLVEGQLSPSTYNRFDVTAVAPDARPRLAARSETYDSQCTGALVPFLSSRGEQQAPIVAQVAPTLAGSGPRELGAAGGIPAQVTSTRWQKLTVCHPSVSGRHPVLRRRPLNRVKRRLARDSRRRWSMAQAALHRAHRDSQSEGYFRHWRGATRLDEVRRLKSPVALEVAVLASMLSHEVHDALDRLGAEAPNAVPPISDEAAFSP